MSKAKELSIAEQYGFNHQEKTGGDIVQIEEAKAMHEIQASLVIAKKFPRDVNQVFSKIIASCQRPMLAEQAIYAYPRGGKTVTGPSIRLAEVLAQNWGNMVYGVREISQSNGVSVAQAYAWDLETNVKQVKEFQVPHVRHTNNGTKKLTDPRDIYELVANNGARRMRACILGVIPIDIQEAATAQCEKTLSSGEEPIEDRIRKMILLFKEFGVSQEQIEKRLGHKVDAIIEAEIVTLRGIYKSIKDGMATREDFFGFEQKPSGKASAITDLLAKENESIESAAKSLLDDSWENFKNEVK